MDEILKLTNRIQTIAQQRRETATEFGERTQTLLNVYNELCKNAQIEFRNIYASSYKREREVIEIFLYGLRSDVKRYICKPEVYNNLKEAREHARSIEKNLKDLTKMKRRSIINI